MSDYLASGIDAMEAQRLRLLIRRLEAQIEQLIAERDKWKHEYRKRFEAEREAEHE